MAHTKAGYICADQTVILFFACNEAADHTFRIGGEIRMVLDEQTIPARSAKRRGAAGFRKPCTNRYHRFRFARHVPYLGYSQVRDLGSVTVR
jgi:hypothetical protein